MILIGSIIGIILITIIFYTNIIPIITLDLVLFLFENAMKGLLWCTIIIIVLITISTMKPIN